MVGHGGSSAGLYLADSTSPIPSHCASIVVTSTVRVKILASKNVPTRISFLATVRIHCVSELCCCLFFHHSFVLHRLESRTRPILTPYDGRHWWDLNLHTPACEWPAQPLCYGCRQLYVTRNVQTTKYNTVILFSCCYKEYCDTTVWHAIHFTYIYVYSIRTFEYESQDVTVVIWEVVEKQVGEMGSVHLKHQPQITGIVHTCPTQTECTSDGGDQ